jgi:hypothetical protein
MYSTSAMLRTIELILGLPPMSQYDAAATPMYRCFTSVADTRAFTHIAANIDINEHNKVTGTLQQQSERMDFSAPDRAPDLELNQLIWASVKGNIPYPGLRRAAFVKLRGEED